MKDFIKGLSSPICVVKPNESAGTDSVFLCRGGKDGDFERSVDLIVQVLSVYICICMDGSHTSFYVDHYFLYFINIFNISTT